MPVTESVTANLDGSGKQYIVEGGDSDALSEFTAAIAPGID